MSIGEKVRSVLCIRFLLPCKHVTPFVIYSTTLFIGQRTEETEIDRYAAADAVVAPVELFCFL